MTTQHTPGPWEAWLPGRKFVIPTRNFNAVCELVDFARDPETVDANARLIAAAPELLAACEAVLSSPTYGDTPSEEAVEMVRAAIAKARGES